MRTPGIQRMAGSANNNRFAVFEFEEDLFLEPIRVLDEKEIKLLKARDQQQNPEPKVSQVQRLPPNAITKASQVERVPSATTTNVSQSEKVSVVSSTKISHLERVPPIASTSATAETSTSIDADATAASECAAAGNSDADISDELLKCVNVMTGNVERLQQEVLRSVRMHSILKKSKQQGATYLKDRDAISTVAKKPRLFDAARTEAVKRKKVCDLMRLGGNILRQIMQHRWAWPFLQPVDVEGLQLHDYYQIIRNPMDLGTIRSRLEAKDGTGYGHVRELCEDVRLVFRNAMLYNESWTEVHVMAKALLAKFENKWKTSIEPRLLEEEEKLFEDQSEGYMVEVARVRTQDEQTAEQLHKDVLSQVPFVKS
ncbi:hypothetical protein KP509_31G056100 [Ceratopteris richardii]|uniref:Bromo domain-containing protein n=1 Tax=Ceratopteris richardii TaxID=49495 RepID=A0A8T2R029_CERRI|nr:hypothetical protein KP509_31G056100 [Ceratopteris richardii]